MPSKVLYNQHQAFRLRGPLNIEALCAAFTEIVRRHEAIRTSIANEQGTTSQIIHPPSRIDVPVFDLSETPIADRQAAFEERVRELAARRFDLTKDTLIRPYLLRTDQQDYVLMWSMHHIATDGWSMSILRGELGTFYTAHCRGQSPVTDELKYQYADFAAWQRRSIQGPHLERLVDFWREELKGIPETLELPTDRPRTNEPRFRGRRLQFKITESVSGGIRALAREMRVTPYMLLVAAFQVLLFRYSNQREFAIGSPIAGRMHQEFEPCIGLFINLFALHARFGDEVSFSDHLRQVRSTCLKAYAHQDLPFELLVDELDPQRSLARHPLVQVMFALQTGTPELLLDGLQTEPMQVAGAATRFELEIYLRDETSCFSGACVYDRDLWDESSITRFFEHYRSILGHVIEDPHQSVNQIPLMSGDEQARVLDVWAKGASSSEFSVDPVHRTFEQRCTEIPDSIAAGFEETQLTYRELNERSNQLANYLLSNGITDGAHVGVCLERSLESLVCVLAIFKAGAVYVPLDPREPELRQAHFAEHADLSCTIFDGSRRATANESEKNKLHFGTIENELSAHSKSNPQVDVGPNSLAYIFFTSGTTGAPKGVMVEHRSLAVFLQSMAMEPGLTADDRLLSLTSTTFDISLLELLLPLVVGAQLEIVSRDVARDGASLCEKLKSKRFTVMQATPTTWRMLLAANWRGQDSLKILCGGESMTEDLAKQLIPRCRSLWNMYGPTESTIWSTIHQVKTTADANCIGRPIAGTTAYVLDEQSQPVPAGIPGELAIGGQGVARGYYGQQTLTDDRFIENPGDQSERLYRTGDRVRWLPNGTLEFHGRVDSQVKLRGHRIELGEIETVLSTHSDVKQGIAVLSQSEPDGERIAFYFVTNESAIIDEISWRDFAVQRLPVHMIPASFVHLSALPLTPNGKIDRRSLAERKIIIEDKSPSVAQELTPTQTLIAQTWMQRLSLGRVRPEDDFFHIGGNSLVAMQANEDLESRLKIRVPVRLLFESSTLGGFAAVIDELIRETSGTAKSADAVDHLEVLRHGDSPVTFAWIGQVRGHQQLMRQVLPESSLCWLKMEGWHMDHFQDRSVAERAKIYADELLHRFPEHRFVVSAFCLSAMYAHGLAQELLSRGIDVVSLAVFEPMVPWPEIVARKNSIADDGTAAGNDLAAATADYQSHLQWMLHKTGTRCRVAADKLTAAACRIAGRPIPVHARWHYYFRWLRGAAKAYEVTPYHGRMAIIGRRQYLDRWGDVWEKYVTEEIATLPLNTMGHVDIFQSPHAETWGKWLNDYLARSLNS